MPIEHAVFADASLPESSSAIRKLLMFAFHVPPSEATGARRPFRFAKYLTHHGYQTHVITASQQFSDAPWKWALPAPDGEPGRGARVGSQLGRAVQRLLPYNDQLPWVPYATEAAERFLTSTRPAAILSTSPPVACHLAAMAIKARYGIPWIADFRDPIYGNPSRNRKWGWLWDAPIDRLILSQADAVIANTDQAAAMFTRRYPDWAGKIHLIWNGFDPEHALAPSAIPPRDYRLIVHAGSLYGQRHPTLLLNSIAGLINAGKLDPRKIRVRLVGDLAREEPWVGQSPFEWLVSLGCVEATETAVPADAAIAEMATADFLLLLDLNDRGLGLQVPAKLFEYIQIGRPVIAFTGRNSPTQRILTASGIRHVIIHADDSAGEIDRRLLAGLALPTDPLRASDRFYAEFDGAAQTRKLVRILSNLSGSLSREHAIL
jgi:hypothetical protein